MSLTGWREVLGRRVSPYSLAVFRIAFGLVMAYESLYALTWPDPHGNFVSLYYTGPHVRWSFPYPGFEWIHPLPEPWTTLLFATFGLAGLLVAAGLFQRLAAAVMFAAFTATCMMEEAYFLNHFYLASLFSLLLATMPASAEWSLDAWLRDRNLPPEAKPPTSIPFWPVLLLRGQLLVVYFFAGIAKLNPDWLVGEPVRLWFSQPNHAAYLENFFNPNQMLAIRGLLAHELTIYFVCYGGLLFDLAVPFLLSFGRTRLLGLALCGLFHGINFFLLNIGAFPVMAMTATLIFLDCDWPIRFGQWLRQPRWIEPDWKWLTRGALLVPGIGALLGWRLGVDFIEELRLRRVADATVAAAAPLSSRLTAAFVGLWLAVQVLVPLRHWMIPGAVHWTDEGSRFSWFMMLRHKEPGILQFEVVDPVLLPDDPQTGRRIAWEHWQGPRPRTDYLDVDAGRVPWESLPAIVVVHEPFLGERIVFNPRSREAASGPEAIRRQIEGYWQQHFQRTPTIRKLYPLGVRLAELRQLVEQDESQGRLRVVSIPFHQLLLAAQQIEAFYHHDRDEHRLTLAAGKLQEIFRRMSGETRLRQPFFEALALAYPFAIQGGIDEGDFFWIDDGTPGFRSSAGAALWQHEPGQWLAGQRVLIDLRRFESGHLSGLGEIIALYDLDGRPRLVWNYDVEIHLLQAKGLRLFGYMQHQYAQRIAQRWEERFGRRPQVYVTSFVKLNQHPTQRLIDPAVDLASVPLYTLRHNPWILPMARGEAAGRSVEAKLAPMGPLK